MVDRPGMTPAAAALLENSRLFYPVIALFVDWPGDPSYSHSGVGVLTTGGRNFQGVGPAARIQIPSEQDGFVPGVAEVELAGVPDHMLEVVASQDARGKRVTMWVGFAKERGGNELVFGTGLIDLFTGFIVKQRIRLQATDGNTINQSLIISVGTGPRGRASASVTHSDEDQRSKYPGDTAGRHLIYGEKNSRKEFWTP